MTCLAMMSSQETIIIDTMPTDSECAMVSVPDNVRTSHWMEQMFETSHGWSPDLRHKRHSWKWYSTQGQELASDFLERWNWQAASINVRRHARAASDDAVDVLDHEHFTTDFLARDGLHHNLKGNRCVLRGITGAIHHIRHVIIDLSIFIVQVWQL